MSDIDVQQMIGPSAIMQGAEIKLEEAIRVSREKFADRSFCIVNEWVWLDLDAPDVVVEELALEGMKPIMLLVFEVVCDSSTN